MASINANCPECNAKLTEDNVYGGNWCCDSCDAEGNICELLPHEELP